jgi:hypothetical protein
MTKIDQLCGHAIGAALNPIVECVDVDGVMRRIDVNAVVSRIAINDLLDRVNVENLLDRISILGPTTVESKFQFHFAKH